MWVVPTRHQQLINYVLTSGAGQLEIYLDLEFKGATSEIMFDYVTYKYVRLRDSKLGALYYILALLILIYSLVEIFLRKGYMQVSLVTATVTT